MMEQRGQGVKRWANFLLVMREENIPERETAVPSTRRHPTRLESGVQNLSPLPSALSPPGEEGGNVRCC
jgi:hypothetical protein